MQFESMKLAIAAKDISICDAIRLKGLGDVTTEELRVECYERYVTAHPHQNVCPRISNDFKCVRALAVSSDKPSACFIIDDSRYKVLCVFYVGASQHNSNTCNVLPQQIEQQKCKQLFLDTGIQG